MKIARFVLLFGMLSLALVACGTPTPTSTPTPNVSPSSTPLVDTPTPGMEATVTLFPSATVGPSPTDDDTPIAFPPDTQVVTWHRAGGIAGFCDDVSVLAGGAYTVENCKASSSKSGQLSASQLLQLTHLVNKLQSFVHEDSTPPGASDAMLVRLTFKGAGPLQPTAEDAITLTNFVLLLMVQVTPGSGVDQYPPAVSKARDFLAAQLNVPAGQITLVSVEAVEWPDRCLGVTIVGQLCAMGVTPGYRVVLQASQGRLYELHTDESGESIRQVVK